MALSRLHDTLIPYILDYLDPDGSIRENPRELDYETSVNSKGIKKAYMRNNALTLFTHESNAGEMVFSGALRPDLCFKGNFRFGHREDTDHDSFHKSKADFEQEHTHIIKGKTSPEHMNENDVRCILKHIKQFEAQIGLCNGERTDCLLSQDDADAINKAHEKYLRQQRRAPRLAAAAEKMYSELESHCIKGAQSFSLAFLHTLLDKYIRPLMITQGYKNATWCVEAAKSSITLLLSSSITHTAMDAIIRNTLSPVLEHLGLNPRYIEKITTEIGAIAAFLNNPLSAIEWSITGSAAALGQASAYQIIRALPKLKAEPAISHTDTQTPVKSAPEHAGLRKRFSSH
ncbi:hypothetical protein AQUSIP_16940 [Aquicella siphonis]|uniref:Uncharacterized protein n=1 Tax=Aquicella siphonis TaxID=254247 RepID=A0A5E4PJ28_9COXI|nr:hypothetical protein [Aquicella siphonis]VVC76382.1 hypothetical protein AQUSIP_16940 [Aquicella siphonis]